MSKFVNLSKNNYRVSIVIFIKFNIIRLKGISVDKKILKGTLSTGLNENIQARSN